MAKIGENIKMSRSGNIITLEIDLSVIGHQTPPKKNRFGRWYPGSDVVASTRGNIPIGEGLRLGVNLFKPRTDTTFDEEPEDESLEVEA